jgi:hypothetical protein
MVHMDRVKFDISRFIKDQAKLDIGRRNTFTTSLRNYNWTHQKPAYRQPGEVNKME